MTLTYAIYINQLKLDRFFKNIDARLNTLYKLQCFYKFTIKLNLITVSNINWLNAFLFILPKINY